MARQNGLSTDHARHARVGRRECGRVVAGKSDFFIYDAADGTTGAFFALRALFAQDFLITFVSGAGVAMSSTTTWMYTILRAATRSDGIAVNEWLAFTGKVNVVLLVVGFSRIVDLSRTGLESSIFGNPIISVLAGAFRCFLVGREADKSADDENDDADANHQADVLHRHLALLILRVGLEKRRRATFGCFAPGWADVTAGTNHFRGARWAEEASWTNQAL